MTAFPMAPMPPPPKKLMIGGPQGLGETEQGSVLCKSLTLKLLTPSIVRYLTFPSPSTKI